MKKKIPMICNIICVILVITFVIKTIMDYKKYTESFGSAPFSVWVLVNVVYLIIPAIIVWIIGILIKRKK